MSNRAEYLAGTNPVDKKSKLGLSAIREPDGVTIQWSAVVGKRYQLESSPKLVAPKWEVVTGETATGDLLRFKHTAPGARTQFYRVRLVE